jgi:hypothetical protein
MIGLALLAGVILGFRFRIGLVLTATALVFLLTLGLQIGAGSGAAAALAIAALCASIAQVVAFLVHVVKYTLDGRAKARA